MGGSSVRVDRIAAVVATLRDGREQVGSGYLVSGRLVLTAEHCSRDRVTGEPRPGFGWSAQAMVPQRMSSAWCRTPG